MNSFTGAFTISGTGNQSFTGLGFQPSYLEFVFSQKFGVAENSVGHLSIGMADGTRQSAHSILGDTTGPGTRNSNAKCCSHWKRVSGAWSEIIAASFVSFDADGFTLNASAFDTNFQGFVKALA